MKKSFFSLVCALAAGALFGSLASPVKADYKAPDNLALLNKVLAKVKPGQKFILFGDMAVPVERVRAFRDQQAGTRTTKSAFDTRTRYWPGGLVPYAFDDDLPQVARDAFVTAGKEWAKYANLTFVPYTNQANYIQVHKATVANGVSFSALGMTGGQQGMTLQPDVSVWVTAHEIGHALGLDHEHQRSDRDQFVEIHLENVKDDDEGQFTIISNTDNHGTYDFDSIMHYFGTAFSTNGQRTIVARPGYEKYQNLMGQQSHLSELDKAGMAEIYGYPAGVTATPVPTPTLPPFPTVSVAPTSVKEGNTDTTPRNELTFSIKLTPSQMPNKDVTFSYKIVTGSGSNSATAGVDFTADELEGTLTVPAAATESGNRTREVEISLPIIGDNDIENDESVQLVLSNLTNARFPNNASTVSAKGTILNDDFAATATPVPTNTARPTATPLPEPTATPEPTESPEPTATPIPAPSARISLSPTKILANQVLRATVTLTPAKGTTGTLEWKVNGTTVSSTTVKETSASSNVYQLDLSKVPSAKRGATISVSFTPVNGSVKGSTATASIVVGNTPPVANAASLTTLSGAPVTTTLTASDADGDAPLAFIISVKPTNGTAILSQSNGKTTLTYRSITGFVGTDSIGIVAGDDQLKSQTATIQVRVNSNSAPILGTVTPTEKSYPTGSTILFTQTVTDDEKNFAFVSLMLINSATTPSGRQGVYLQYDVANRVVRLANSGNTGFLSPVAPGATLENEYAKVVLRAVAYSGNKISLSWQITPKAGWTGIKTFWAKVEDTSSLVDGFTQEGQVAFTSPSSSTKTTASAGNS